MNTSEAKKRVLDWIDAHAQELSRLLVDMIRAKPINGSLCDYSCTEEGTQKVITAYLKAAGIETQNVPIDLSKLETYRGLPGFTPGHTDKMNFDGRDNVMAKISGTNPNEARSLMLVGHVDVVPVSNPDKWEHNPHSGDIADGYIWGRGAVDMLAGLAGMAVAMKALKQEDIKLKGDLWYGSISGEETGGTGMLAFSEYLRTSGLHADAAIMGEPTNMNLSLLCRGILWNEVHVYGKTGHLEVTQPHWSEGGTVNAIDKALYIARCVEELNKDWRIRPDKNHKLLNLPCQCLLSRINGGHHDSSYPEHCVLCYNVQVLPKETDENGLCTATRREFEEFIARVAQTDGWLREHPPKVEWTLEANCGEVDEDHPFVDAFMSTAREIDPKIQLSGSEFHTDNEWPQRLAGIPTVNYGPGNPALAHNDNEKVSVDDLLLYAKVIAGQCIDWCGLAET